MWGFCVDTDTCIDTYICVDLYGDTNMHTDDTVYAPRAIAYLRVSTDDQDLRSQHDQILRHTPSICAVYIDHGVSGGDEIHDRPGLSAALEALRPGDTLIAAKRDRLARDTVIAVMISRAVKAKGCKLVTADGLLADDTAEGRMMAGMVDVFAEYERNIIKSRTVAALRAKRDRNEPWGHAPYGWSSKGSGQNLVPNMYERDIESLGCALRAKGFGYGGIAKQLSAKGYKTRKGKEWSIGAVRELLRRGEECVG